MPEHTVNPWEDWDNLEPSDQNIPGHWYHRPTGETFCLGTVNVMANKSPKARAAAQEDLDEQDPVVAAHEIHPSESVKTATAKPRAPRKAAAKTVRRGRPPKSKEVELPVAEEATEVKSAHVAGHEVEA